MVIGQSATNKSNWIQVIRLLRDIAVGFALPPTSTYIPFHPQEETRPAPIPSPCSVQGTNTSSLMTA
ncbi:hypothetical protein [Methanosphaerula palustris]|uniref:hypothetical protein n=1 Tax=Methanosphaerula palustris TaxID=475088 RepID=UPI000321E034|nr:hypothetical protein [Methanosphaerula palustris]